MMLARSDTVRPREHFVLLAGFAFVSVTLLAGPLRMYLSTLGLAPLVYVPNLLMAIAIGWQLLAEPRDTGFTATRLVALLIPPYAVIVGLQFIPPVQVAMGLYVLLPFVFGIACGTVFERNWASVARFVPWLWAVAVSGVILNLRVEYPWEGFGYDLGSLEVEGSRQWYADGGVKRLAGFARASFDAAVQVLLTGVLFALGVRRTLLRAVLWGVTIAAILPTNSKGVLLAAAVLAPIVLFGTKLPQTLLRALPAIFGGVALALPISALLFTFDSPLRDPALASATYSFFDRLNDMWPTAWALLSDGGNFLLGRGVGGIGTAQTYFEPALFNAGDNLFMYWFVVFGWVALPGFVLLLLRSIRIRPHLDNAAMRVYCLLLATLVYGSITNIVENAFSALICGMVVRCLAAAPMARPSARLQSAGDGRDGSAVYA